MSLIKSKKRVADHGEVFTPDWLVEKMLDLVNGELAWGLTLRRCEQCPTITRAKIMRSITKSIGIAVLAISLLSNPLQAQPRPSAKSTKLSCSGSFHYFANAGDAKTTSVDISGVFVEASESFVKIIGVPQLSEPVSGTVYNVSTVNQQSIGFKNPNAEDQGGSLNRITGKIFVYEILDRKESGALTFSSSFSGMCSPYKPIL